MVNFVICEFNPFHNGHRYLLQHIGPHPTICIMSSHVTQRGEFAFCDKWTRARMALENGADLVLELPAPFAMGQASRFAAGATAIAKATGLEGRLCFGTEGDVAHSLKQLASIEESQLPIKSYLAQGLPLAAALAKAYEEHLPQAAGVLSTPNNMLGLEYIKAAPQMEIFTLPRQGVAHDAGESQGCYCSASALRQCPEQYKEFTPASIHNIYNEVLTQGKTPDAGKTELVWLHALRSLSAERWDTIAPDGVGRRFYKAAQSAVSMNELLQQVKTKCVTLASLRRLALKAFIGEPPCDTPQYIRVLGLTATGRQLLAEMNPSLPVLTKPAAIKTLSPEAQALMQYESALTDHYMFLLQSPGPKGVEFLTSPIIK